MQRRDYSLEDVMKALEAADRVATTGETPEKRRKAAEDARRLARMAKMVSKIQPEKAPEGFFPHVKRGIARTMGLPGDIMKPVVERLPQPVGRHIGFGLPPTPEFERAFGVEGLEEPQKISEHIGQTIGETVPLLFPGALAVRALSFKRGVVGKIAKPMWSSIKRHPYLAATAELTAAGGAGVGRGLAQEEGFGTQLGAELAGGIVGGAAPGLAAKYTPVLWLLRRGANLLTKIALPATKRGGEYRAGKYVREKAAYPEKAIKEIDEEAIADLPPAVRSGEIRLQQLYKNLVGQDPLADSVMIERTTKAITKLEKEMNKIGYGSPELIKEITQKRIAALELGMNMRVAKALEKVQEKVEKLPVAQRLGSEGIIVRNELHSVMEKERTKVRKLWADVRKGVEVRFDNTRKVFTEISNDLAYSQKKDIPAVLRTDPIIINKGLTKTTVKEMQGLRSKLLEEARRARKNNKENKARIAENMAKAILDDLDRVEGVPELRTAIAATRQFKLLFQDGEAGRILGYSMQGTPAIDPSLVLEATVGRLGVKGAVDIDKIIVTPEARLATERYLGRVFTDNVTDIDGNVDFKKAANFVRKNEEILDHFPGLKEKMLDITNSQQLASETIIRMEARKKRLRNPNISAAARFLNKADMGKEIEGIFKDRDAVYMMRELAKRSRNDKDALEGLRAGTVEYMLEKSHIGRFNEFGQRSWSGSTLLGFIKDNYATLKEVFTSEQIERIRKIGRELTRVEVYEALPYRKEKIEIDDWTGTFYRLIGRLWGAGLGGYIGARTPIASTGGSLQYAQLYSGLSQKFMGKLATDKAVQITTDAILADDPKLLKALLVPMDKPTSKAGQMQISKLSERMNLWLVGTGRRVLEEMEREHFEDEGQQEEDVLGDVQPLHP